LSQEVSYIMNFKFFMIIIIFFSSLQNELRNLGNREEIFIDLITNLYFYFPFDM
jgi:hypothetical protein